MGRIGRALVLALLVAACEAASPSALPSPTDTAVPVRPPGPAKVVACIGINTLECDQVADRLRGVLPALRGDPFSVQVSLVPCADADAPCPPSLAARSGTATVEYADESEPLVFRVAGEPLAPSVEAQSVGPWTDTIQPGSPQADGPGRYAFEVGHCGILHVVDFDGSFWVLAGQVDAAHPALHNADTGTIELVDQERARYVSSDDVTFDLARFPGARRFQLCD